MKSTPGSRIAAHLRRLKIKLECQTYAEAARLIDRANRRNR